MSEQEHHENYKSNPISVLLSKILSGFLSATHHALLPKCCLSRLCRGGICSVKGKMLQATGETQIVQSSPCTNEGKEAEEGLGELGVGAAFWFLLNLAACNGSLKSNAYQKQDGRDSGFASLSKLQPSLVVTAVTELFWFPFVRFVLVIPQHFVVKFLVVWQCSGARI